MDVHSILPKSFGIESYIPILIPYYPTIIGIFPSSYDPRYYPILSHKKLRYSHDLPMTSPRSFHVSPFTWIQLTTAQGVALLCRLDLGTADATGERPNGAHVRHHAGPDAFSKPMGPTWVEKIWDKHMG